MFATGNQVAGDVYMFATANQVVGDGYIGCPFFHVIDDKLPWLIITYNLESTVHPRVVLNSHCEIIYST